MNKNCSQNENHGIVTITEEEYNYLLKRDAQLEFALDMVPNLDEVIELMEED